MRLARSSSFWIRLCAEIPQHLRLGPIAALQQFPQRGIVYSATAAFSLDGSSSMSPADERRKLVNKLLYRSKQRGWLELDLLVGTWAEQQIPSMDVSMLQSYAAVLEEENPDLYKWLTGQLQPPEHMLHNSAFVALRAHVQQAMSENSSSETRAAEGKEWVRGWDDGSQKQQPAPAAG